MKKIIWIFNLETNLDSPVLASTHDWVQEFSTRYKIVNVYSTHLGRTNLPPNVLLREIGGGNHLLRARGLFRLIVAGFRIAKVRKESVVFYHMNSRSACILGLPLRFLGVKQILWYSHSIASVDLFIAEKFVNGVVTSFQGAYPRNTKKVRYIGHGIKSSRFAANNRVPKCAIDLISVGRISPIKHLEAAISAVIEVRNELKLDLKIEFIGPTSENEYLRYLTDLARVNSINLKFVEEMDFAALAKKYSSASLYFTGTPKSVDKATLEAAMCGCMVISDNPAVHFLTGMSEVWESLGFKSVPKIESQIKTFIQLTELEINQLRAIVVRITCERNDLTQTVSTISEILNSSE